MVPLPTGRSGTAVTDMSLTPKSPGQTRRPQTKRGGEMYRRPVGL
jgi:hypothetical protein